jgi:hypothetical protein
MKIASKNALTLGGLYLVISTLLAFSDNFIINIISDLLLGGFLICLIYSLIKNNLEFIISFQNSYPKITYYINSIGWIAYTSLLASAVIIISYLLNGEYSEEVRYEMLIKHLIYLNYLDVFLIICSLIAAYLFRKKQHA